jgi:hypothetical protein
MLFPSKKVKHQQSGCQLKTEGSALQHVILAARWKNYRTQCGLKESKLLQLCWWSGFFGGAEFILKKRLAKQLLLAAYGVKCPQCPSFFFLFAFFFLYPFLYFFFGFSLISHYLFS